MGQWEGEREKGYIISNTFTWRIRTHGVYVHMEYTYTWSISTHGDYIHMENTYTWRLHTHGEVNKLIDTVRGRDWNKKVKHANNW